MARYRLRPIEFEAEPYREGLEDEFSEGAVPVLVTPTGQLELALGDWIVTASNGERQVVKARIFEMFYERCPSEAVFQLTERVRRGMPMRSG